MSARIRGDGPAAGNVYRAVALALVGAVCAVLLILLSGCDAPPPPKGERAADSAAIARAMAARPQARGMLLAATVEPGITKVTEVGVSLDFDWGKLTPAPDSQRLIIRDSSATSTVIHHNSKVTASHTTKTVTVPASPVGRVYRVCLFRYRGGVNLTPTCPLYKIGAGILVPVEPPPPPPPVPVSARFDSVVVETPWAPPASWGATYAALVGYDVKSWRRDTTPGVVSVQDVYVDGVRIANDTETGLYVTGYVPRKAKGTVLQLRICARLKSGATVGADSTCSRTVSYTETRENPGTPPPPPDTVVVTPPPTDTTDPGYLGPRDPLPAGFAVRAVEMLMAPGDTMAVDSSCMAPKWPTALEGNSRLVIGCAWDSPAAPVGLKDYSVWYRVCIIAHGTDGNVYPTTQFWQYADCWRYAAGPAEIKYGAKWKGTSVGANVGTIQYLAPVRESPSRYSLTLQAGNAGAWVTTKAVTLRFVKPPDPTVTAEFLCKTRGILGMCQSCCYDPNTLGGIFGDTVTRVAVRRRP